MVDFSSGTNVNPQTNTTKELSDMQRRAKRHPYLAIAVLAADVIVIAPRPVHAIPKPMAREICLLKYFVRTITDVEYPKLEDTPKQSP